MSVKQTYTLQTVV